MWVRLRSFVHTEAALHMFLQKDFLKKAANSQENTHAKV